MAIRIPACVRTARVVRTIATINNVSIHFPRCKIAFENLDGRKPEQLFYRLAFHAHQHCSWSLSDPRRPPACTTYRISRPAFEGWEEEKPFAISALAARSFATKTR